MGIARFLLYSVGLMIFIIMVTILAYFLQEAYIPSPQPVKAPGWHIQCLAMMNPDTHSVYLECQDAP